MIYLSDQLIGITRKFQYIIPTIALAAPRPWVRSTINGSSPSTSNNRRHVGHKHNQSQLFLLKLSTLGRKEMKEELKTLNTILLCCNNALQNNNHWVLFILIVRPSTSVAFLEQVQAY